LSYSPTSRRKA